MNHSHKLAVFSERYKKELWRFPINRTKYSPHGKTFIVGVTWKMGLKFFMPVDDFVYFPVKQHKRKSSDKTTLIPFGLKMKTHNSYQSIPHKWTNSPKNHGAKDPDKDGFAVRSMDPIDGYEHRPNGISLLLFSIACISLIVWWRWYYRC